MCETRKFKRGDAVLYRGGFGMDEPKRGVIIGVDEKNGRKVYDVRTGNGKWDTSWGYEEQFELA